MIIYYCVPYSLQSLATQNEAIVLLNKHLGGALLRNPSVVPLCALFSVYKNPHTSGNIRDEQVYNVCRALIDSCEIFVVLRLKGWEYSDIVTNEIGYAAFRNKVIVYEDPHEQVLP